MELHQWLLSSTDLAGALPSCHVSCTQHVVSQLRVLLLALALRDDVKLQLLQGFRIWQRIY